MERFKSYSKCSFEEIYCLISNHDKENIERLYPELIPYYDTLDKAINIYSKRYEKSLDSNDKCKWVSCILIYIEITNNKELIINDDIIDLIGEPSTMGLVVYLYKYIGLMYPEDFVKHNVDIYISEFYEIARNILLDDKILSKIKNNEYSFNPRLTRLLNTLLIIDRKHRGFYTSTPHRFMLLIVASYCHANNIEYDMAFNYINNPDYYMDKLYVNGFITYDESGRYIWKGNTKDAAFQSINEIFSKGKIPIN